MSLNPALAARLQQSSLGLLGAGNMAEALVRGVLRAGAIPAPHIFASDVSAERRTYFSETLGIDATAENDAVVANSDLLVLCVKPYQVDAVLNALAGRFRPEAQLLVSICAGVSTERMEKHLPAGARVLRVMPNTPMLVGMGACGIARGHFATDADLELVEALFSTAALTVRVEERMMDAVTGLSGSGPAYLFYLVEAMVDAGVAEGFSRPQALALATRTVLGAAAMLESTGKAPEELRRQVTSPNGTTQAAIESLDAAGVKAALSAAVRRAAERSRELGKG